jgi:hypothetical protein
MDQIDGPSLGEIFKPLAWDKTRTEGAKILQRLIDLPMPVVGEVNGPAIVHSEYLLLADVHIASERATYLSSAPGFQAPWSRPWPSLGRPAPAGETVTADNAVDRELVMKIPARELAIGDIFRINDWQFPCPGCRTRGGHRCADRGVRFPAPLHQCRPGRRSRATSHTKSAAVATAK